MKQPYKNIKQLIHLDRDEYLIRYRLSYLCNYHCKGCYQDSYRDWPLVIPKEQMELISKKINQIGELLPKDKPTTLYLEGGEVSLFDIESLVLKYINLKNISTLKLVTNLSASTEYYKNLLNICIANNVTTRWQASLHLEECNPLEFFNKIKQLPIDLVIVGINSNNLELYRPWLQYMADNNIRFTVNHWRDGNSISSELDSELDYWDHKSDIKAFKVIYKNNAEELLSSREVATFFNKIKVGTYCTGRYNLCINPDGTLYFICSEKNPLGNILNSTVDLSDIIKKIKPCVCIKQGYCNHNCGGIHLYNKDND